MLKILLIILWFLLLYAFSHEEKVHDLYESLKKNFHQFYWGNTLLQCQKLQSDLIFGKWPVDGSKTSYSSLLEDLVTLKSTLGEDIEKPLKNLKNLLAQEIQCRTKMRQVLGESSTQMFILMLMINGMGVSFNHFLELKPRFIEFLVLNLLMIIGFLIFRQIFEMLMGKKIYRYIRVSSNLNQFQVLAGTSVSTNEISRRISFREFERSWEGFEDQKNLLHDALSLWSENGMDPREALDHISFQIHFKLEGALRSFGKLIEASKLVILIIFFLIPHILFVFLKLFGAIEKSFG